MDSDDIDIIGVEIAKRLRRSLMENTDDYYLGHGLFHASRDVADVLAAFSPKFSKDIFLDAAGVNEKF